MVFEHVLLFRHVHGLPLALLKNLASIGKSGLGWGGVQNWLIDVGNISHGSLRMNYEHGI